MVSAVSARTADSPDTFGPIERQFPILERGATAVIVGLLGTGFSGCHSAGCCSQCLASLPSIAFHFSYAGYDDRNA